MAITGPKTDWKLIPETVTKLHQAFSVGCSVTEACIYAGISRNTFYRWTKENPELNDKIEQLQILPILKARKTIVDNLNNPKIAMWYLERRRPEEFSPRYQVSSDKEVVIQVVNYQDSEVNESST